jgi:hypothetical protein
MNDETHICKLHNIQLVKIYTGGQIEEICPICTPIYPWTTVGKQDDIIHTPKRISL